MGVGCVVSCNTRCHDSDELGRAKADAVRSCGRRCNELSSDNGGSPVGHPADAMVATIATIPTSRGTRALLLQPLSDSLSSDRPSLPNHAVATYGASGSTTCDV